MNISISNLKFINKTLRELAEWVEVETGVAFTITSLFRIEDSGVHGTMPLRGIDLRMRDATIGKAVETLINEYWVYDYKRPRLKCALFHDAGTGLHLHLQTHKNTILSKEE
jgi:hypothetical protein